MDAPTRYHFVPEEHEEKLLGIISELASLAEVDSRALTEVLKRYPKGRGETYSKSEIIRGFRYFAARHGLEENAFVPKLQMKPVRTGSGVAPVTVLTKPYPCPGDCIFCPSDVKMPKSYLSMEPGAQRAGLHRFDPYAQVATRLAALHNNGHRVDKVELIVLGGSWTAYPESYQRWFIKRCFDALNAFDPERRAPAAPEPAALSFEAMPELEDGARYNAVVSRFLRAQQEGQLVPEREDASWEALEAAHRENELARARSVGLVLETRPDEIDDAEVIRLRRLGATKIQLGVQSLSDEILRLNRRGHDLAATQRAFRLLRLAGFKIHAHWMPNLLGSTVASDIADFARLFEGRDFLPDELKLYPCSLIASADLMASYRQGQWQPYAREELLEVLVSCMASVPPFCRVTRVVRDIPSHDIVVGNRSNNFRQIVTWEMERRGLVSRDIRAREIRRDQVRDEELRLEPIVYETSVGTEVFLQYVTPGDRIVGFLRLSLPSEAPFVEELRGCAMIREVHVYGRVAGIGERDQEMPQHGGLGRRLVEEAARRAKEAGYESLAVISAVGTRAYYRALGFFDGPLYLHRPLS